MIRFRNISVLFFIVVLLSSCNHDFTHIGIHENTRWEYAPNMYHSLAYEPLSQITDSVNYPEYYNSNPYNPHGMTMRHPVPGTVMRDTKGYLPIHIHKDSLEKTALIPNPVALNDQVLSEGEILYQRFCSPCHGAGGEGEGKVGERYGGVPNFKGDALRNASSGHIFHVITFGRNRMTSYATQISQEERWKIAHFVHTLQEQE